MNLSNIIKNLREINLRELVWPLLDPIEEHTKNRNTSRLLKESDYSWDNNEIQSLLYYIEKYKESEDGRLKTVESKSIIFIGAFGITITILIGLINNIASQLMESFNFIQVLLFILITITVIYLCRSVWFSVKALERQEYHTLGLPEFMLNNVNQKKKKIIIELYNGIIKNQEKINLKVDYMTMAQEYFKRAIVAVILFIGVYIINMVMYLLGR